MKSLQIVVPFQTCPFHCPFCIANNPKVESAFANLYESDKMQYLTLLGKVLESNPDLKTVVLTGDTEPTLNMQWLNQVSRFVKAYRPQIKIELQTKNTNPRLIQQLLDNGFIDVYGFSVDSLSQLNKVKKLPYFPQNVIKRVTLLLIDGFDLTKIYELPNIKQVTIKYLQLGDNAQVNEWIENHRWANPYALDIFLKRFKYLVSFMIDENCMASEGRYEIFRSDGFLYKTWTDLPK